MRLITSISWLLVVGISFAQNPSHPILTAQQVHTLTLDQAYKGLPASLKGVISGVNRGAGGGFFIDDGTGGVYVGENSGMDPNIKEGDAISIKGICQPGYFSPYIANATVEKTGTLPLPKPKDIQIDEAMSGAEDGQYVRLNCWMRDHYKDHDETLLTLSNGGFRFTGVLAGKGNLNLDELIGARLLVTGVVSASQFQSGYRRLVSVDLFMGNPNNLVVESPPPPLDSEIVPLKNVGLYSISNSPGRRFRVEGVITYIRESTLFLSDSTGGIEIHSNEDLSGFQLGDTLQATGFSAINHFLPNMEDARLVDLHQSAKVEPKPLSATDLQQGKGHADWVQLNATLLDRTWHSVNPVSDQPRYEINFSFESSKIVFNGSLLTIQPPTGLALPEPGAIVSINALVISQTDNSGNTTGFRLMLNSKENLRVIQPPPYFNSERLLVVIVVVLSLLLILFLVTSLLFIKNTRLSVKLHEDRATMVERARLSSDLHDTIQQMLIGTSWQLDAALKAAVPVQPSVLQPLELAKTYIKQTQSELRRSIWKLRHHSLEGFNLFSALRREAESIGMGTNVKLNVSIPSDVEGVSLDPQVEDNILRITQEAIANALKHGHSEEISLRVFLQNNRLVMEVQDNGQGFALAQKNQSSDHFGLSNMKERADRIGAQFKITSEPKKGTTVRLEFLVKKE